jgi:hypothetical protein
MLPQGSCFQTHVQVVQSIHDYERFWCQDDDDLKKMITVNCTVFVASFVGAHDAHVALCVVYAVVHIEKSKIKRICT